MLILVWIINKILNYTKLIMFSKRMQKLFKENFMKKQIVVVTGGNSGLGLELAKIISKTFSVCIVARDINKLENAIKLLDTTNEHLLFSADISNEDNVKKLYEFLNDFEIKYIINCAGAALFGNPEDINAEMVDYLINCNLKSVMYMSSNGIKALKENGGTIATILSTAALKGNAQESVYCAAKWGARGYCEALKTAFRGTNIKIMTICPGGINTPLWETDCGLSPNVDEFMDAGELAKTIWDVVEDKKTMYCSHVVLEKL